MLHASLKKDSESDAKCTTIPGVNQSLDTAAGKSIDITTCSIKAIFRLAARTGPQSRASGCLHRIIQYCEPFARQNDVSANIVNVYKTLVKCIARAAPLNLLDQAAPLSGRMYIPEAEPLFIHSLIESLAPSIVPVALSSNQNALCSFITWRSSARSQFCPNFFVSVKQFTVVLRTNRSKLTYYMLSAGPFRRCFFAIVVKQALISILAVF
jgi:hypothetical protein